MTQTSGTRDDVGRLIVRSAAEIADLAWTPLDGQEDVASKVLWRSGDVVIGLMRVAPGATKPAHVHYAAHHHIWVVAGEATIVGHRLSTGSYVHIPPGVEHEVADAGPDGCTLFFSHRPVEPLPDQLHRAAAAQ